MVENIFYITLSNKLYDSNFNYERFDHSYCTDVLATYVNYKNKSVLNYISTKQFGKYS